MQDFRSAQYDLSDGWTDKAQYAVQANDPSSRGPRARRDDHRGVETMPMRWSQARTARASADGRSPTARKTKATELADVPVTPVVLDRYRLERRLGSGAFGTVWRARDERLERPVAVKILPRERVQGGRFEREARVAARLAHPGIVTLYEAAVDDDGAYLVSELIRGHTLDALLAEGRLSDRDIVAVGIALCEALAHAHEQGVVHRDVKPSNVLIPSRPVTAAQVAKLTDFGVARVLGGDTLTMTGDVIGTLAYMAPEQAEGLEAGAPADLYSLALVLYEALTGVNPVLLTPNARRSRRLGMHLPPLRRQRRDLPRALGAGIDAALRPRPAERGRLRDLRAALVIAREQVADEPGVVVAPPAGRDDPSRLTGWASTAEHPWREHDHREERSDPAEQARRRHVDADEDRDARDRPAWPARGLGALAAASTGAWLAGQLLTPAPVPVPVAGLIAAGLVLLAPRLGWMALVTGISAYALAQGHPGPALVAATAMLVPILLAPLRPTAWPLGAGAPALGLIGLAGLAGAWPALAGLAQTAWRRAAIAAAGWIALLLATPIAGRILYLAPIPAFGTGDSVGRTADRILLAPLTTGLLAPAAVWAVAAAILPLVVRGRSITLDLVRAGAWAALLTAATPAAIVAVGRAGSAPMIRGAVIGGAAAAILALAPRWLAVRRPTLAALGRANRAGARFP